MKNPLITNLPEVYLESFYKELRKGKLLLDVFDDKAKKLYCAEITIRRADCQDTLINEYGCDYITRYNNLCVSKHPVTLGLRTRLAYYSDDMAVGRYGALYRPRIDMRTIEIIKGLSAENIVTGRDNNGHKLDVETVAHLGAYLYCLKTVALFKTKDCYTHLANVIANEYVPNFDLVDVTYHELEVGKNDLVEMTAEKLTVYNSRRQLNAANATAFI